MVPRLHRPAAPVYIPLIVDSREWVTRGELRRPVGTLPPGLALGEILERAWPQSAEADVADG